jgi:hypothetical protein
VLKLGRHVLRTWSSTQATIATSGVEAELITMYDDAARGMCMQTALEEMGLRPTLSMIQVLTDSSVAKSYVACRGLGRMRHLEVKVLWLREQVQRARLVVGKVSGIEDALTKYGPF